MKRNIIQFLFKNKQFLLIIPILFLLTIFLLIRSCVTGSSTANFEFENSAELLVDLKDKTQAEELIDLLKKYDAVVLLAFPQVQDTEITELDDFYTVDVKDLSVAAKVMTEINKYVIANKENKNKVKFMTIAGDNWCNWISYNLLI